MNRDGTVKTLEVVNQPRMASNQEYQRLADSALEALKNPDCNHFDLDPALYADWNTILITFDPKDMAFGARAAEP
jgi:hypothetical protein